MAIVVEFLSFLRHRRKYWLWPLFLILIILGFFIVIAHSSAIGTLIYTLF